MTALRQIRRQRPPEISIHPCDKHSHHRPPHGPLCSFPRRACLGNARQNRFQMPLLATRPCQVMRPPRARHTTAPLCSKSCHSRPASIRSNGPRSTRCPRRPGSWPSGSRPSLTPTATSSSTAPTTRPRIGSSASASARGLVTSRPGRKFFLDWLLMGMARYIQPRTAVLNRERSSRRSRRIRTTIAESTRA